MRSAAPRFAFIDALKAIASQLIVLHHLAFYGPMSDVANVLAPGLFAWLSQDARIAVQVFLVIGGYLAAKALAPAGELTTAAPLALVRKRYFKLVVPYLAAVLLSVLCAFLARRLMAHDSIPDPASLKQLLAHVVLMQNVLGFDSLSAGAWYVAIDFQLFVLFLALLWFARRIGPAGGQSRLLPVALVAGLGLASLFYFNRISDWDNWALYFFSAYTLGVFAYWTSADGRPRRPAWLLAIAALVAVALIIDFRSRIVVALITALALAASARYGFIETYPKSRIFAYLGKISYSVFLIHFPVVLLTNAMFTRIAPASIIANAVGVALGWAASIAAGALFYRCVESRSARLLELVTGAVARNFERLALAYKARL